MQAGFAREAQEAPTGAWLLPLVLSRHHGPGELLAARIALT
jgi:hypothetical protein